VKEEVAHPAMTGGRGEMEGEERGKIWCKKEEGGENEQHYVHRQDL
jgi:hypothetical protein